MKIFRSIRAFVLRRPITSLTIGTFVATLIFGIFMRCLTIPAWKAGVMVECAMTDMLYLHHTSGRILDYQFDAAFGVSNTWQVIWFALKAATMVLFLSALIEVARTNKPLWKADNRERTYVAIACLVFVGFCVMYQPKFWGDEAYTACYAKHLTQTGEHSAMGTGRSVLTYADGHELRSDMGGELRLPSLSSRMAAYGVQAFRLPRTEFALRLPFILMGLASIPLLYCFSKAYIGGDFPHWIPAVLMGVNLQYMLFMNNCRYYAPSLFFTLLISFLAVKRVRVWWIIPVVAALFFTHYLHAVLILLVLAFVAERRYVLVAAATLAPLLLYTQLTASPFAAEYGSVWQWVNDQPVTPITAQWFEHPVKFIRDMQVHQFIPWLCVPFLFLPGSSRKGLRILGLVIAYVLVVSALLPRQMGAADYSEIRYLVPLLPFCAVVLGVSLFKVYWNAKPIGVLLFVFTILAYMPMHSQPTANGNDHLVDYLGSVPQDTKVKFFPQYCSSVPTYYCGERILVTGNVSPTAFPNLPDYCYVDRVRPDLVVTYEPLENTVRAKLERTWPETEWVVHERLPGDYAYTTRPEIMLRAKRDRKYSYSIFRPL